MHTGAVQLDGQYGAFAFAYDQATGKPAFARLSTLLERVLAGHRPTEATHLDLACGTGLGLALFERLGYTSVGVDFSFPMLRVAARRSGRLIGGDIRAIPLGCTFGAITLLNDTVSSMRSRSDLMRSFRSIRRCMGPESLLLFDITRPRSMSLWTAEDTFRLRGRRYDVSIQTGYSRARHIGVMRIKGWAHDGETKHVIDEVHRLRAWSRAEIVHSLHLAFLRPIDIVPFRRFPRARVKLPQDEAWLFVVKRTDFSASARRRVR